MGRPRPRRARRRLRLADDSPIYGVPERRRKSRSDIDGQQRARIAETVLPNAQRARPGSDRRDLREPLAAQARAVYGAGTVPEPPADPRLGPALAQFCTTDTQFRCGTIGELRWHADAGNVAYEFQFDRVPPGKEGNGAVHASELPYVFGTFAALGASNVIDARVSAAMEQYWTNFAKTGNPNGGGLAQWPAFDSQRRSYSQVHRRRPGRSGEPAQGSLRSLLRDVGALILIKWPINSIVTTSSAGQSFSAVCSSLPPRAHRICARQRIERRQRANACRSPLVDRKNNSTFQVTFLKRMSLSGFKTMPRHSFWIISRATHIIRCWGCLAAERDLPTRTSSATARMDGVSAYDPDRKVVYYGHGCCTYQTQTVAYVSTEPPPNVPRRSLRYLRTERGVHLGMTLDQVHWLEGYGHERYDKKAATTFSAIVQS